MDSALVRVDPKYAVRSTRKSNVFVQSPFVSDVPAGHKGRDSHYAMQSLVRPSDLSTVFQPIVCFDTLEIFALEALERGATIVIEGIETLEPAHAPSAPRHARCARRDRFARDRGRARVASGEREVRHFFSSRSNG